MEQLGCHVVPISPFPGHKYCNKLQQLAPLLKRSFDEVVLLDCDIVVLEDLPAATDGVLAKPVGMPNPPLPVLEKLFDAAGLPLRIMPTDIHGEPTAWANANGGVYVLPRDVTEVLSQAWPRWAHWCLERVDVFGQWAAHVDQVSLALTVAAEEIPYTPLDRRWNFPTHVPQASELDREPAVLHYHRAVTNQQQLLPIDAELPGANAAIRLVNDFLLRRRRKSFSNVLFWNSRYAMHPELGSGVGSRGSTLRRKQEMLSRLVNLLGIESITDVGGGDGRTASALPRDIAVHAFDIAATARELYLEAVPQATWSLHDILKASPAARTDLVVCLDVLIHMSDVDEYLRAVENLCKCPVPLLISGFDAAPVETGTMTYFHEPLSQSLARCRRVVIPIGAYRGLCVLVAFPPSTGIHPRDVSDRTLSQAVPLLRDPSGLLEALVRSRKVLGFFPDHLPRCLEYPWVAAQLGTAPPGGGRVLDAGAGVSVLPVLLAERSWDVVTADPHPVVRNGMPRETWNEWGFLDYHELDPRIRSLHVPYEDTADETLDPVVSVSVVEHLPAAVRRVWFGTAARQLSMGGRIILTVDTVPFETTLWRESLLPLALPLRCAGL